MPCAGLTITRSKSSRVAFGKLNTAYSRSRSIPTVLQAKYCLPITCERSLKLGLNERAKKILKTSIAFRLKEAGPSRLSRLRIT